MLHFKLEPPVWAISLEGGCQNFLYKPREEDKAWKCNVFHKIVSLAQKTSQSVALALESMDYPILKRSERVTVLNSATHAKTHFTPHESFLQWAQSFHHFPVGIYILFKWWPEIAYCCVSVLKCASFVSDSDALDGQRRNPWADGISASNPPEIF